jgi:hypothetical protein
MTKAPPGVSMVIYSVAATVIIRIYTIYVLLLKEPVVAKSFWERCLNCETQLVFVKAEQILDYKILLACPREPHHPHR